MDYTVSIVEALNLSMNFGVVILTILGVVIAIIGITKK